MGAWDDVIVPDVGAWYDVIVPDVGAWDDEGGVVARGAGVEGSE